MSFPGVNYQLTFHGQKQQQGWLRDGLAAGAIDKSVAVTRLAMKLHGFRGRLDYQVNATKKGWLPWVSDGATTGSGKKENPISGVRVRIFAGPFEEHKGVRVLGRVRLRSGGWQEVRELGWTEQFIGVDDDSDRIQALQVWLGFLPESYLKAYQGVADLKFAAPTPETIQRIAEKFPDTTMEKRIEQLKDTATCLAALGAAAVTCRTGNALLCRLNIKTAAVCAATVTKSVSDAIFKSNQKAKSHDPDGVKKEAMGYEHGGFWDSIEPPDKFGGYC